MDVTKLYEAPGLDRGPLLVPQSRRVPNFGLGRSVLTLHRRMRKEFNRALRRAFTGRYVWDPRAAAMARGMMKAGY